MSTRHARAHAHAHKQTHKDFFDYMLYFFAVATPLFEIPQAYDIYSNHSAANVSLVTWGFFCIDNLVWIVYAWRKRLIPVLLTSLLYELLEIAIVLGIILYR
jgi:uncharacterized protein with PQ loop repeat